MRWEASQVSAHAKKRSFMTSWHSTQCACSALDLLWCSKMSKRVTTILTQRTRLLETPSWNRMLKSTTRNWLKWNRKSILNPSCQSRSLRWHRCLAAYSTARQPISYRSTRQVWLKRVSLMKLSTSRSSRSLHLRNGRLVSLESRLAMPTSRRMIQNRLRKVD